MKRLGTIALVLALLLAALPTSYADLVIDYVVNSADDVNDGACDLTHCSLREAMLATNLAGGGGIVFDIPEEDDGYNAITGVWTISPTVSLPPLTGGNVTIDGYSQDGATVGTMWGPPTIVIEINGDEVKNQNGFNIVSAGNTIKGLVINRFGRSGIAIGGTSAMSNTISGNYIGVDPSGTTVLSNTLDGVSILLGAHHNTIGGDSLAEQNVIGGNGGDGIGMVGDNTTGNVVTGNLIGTSRSMADLGNESYGINIYGGAHGNVIGINALYQGNGIDANDLGGVRIAGANTRDNVIAANDIGSSTLGNSGYGVLITEGAHDNTVGLGNDISYGGTGVRIDSTSTMSNTISGNRIYHNSLNGVRIYAAKYNVIGGDTESERNYIYSNSDSGVLITGAARNNTISGNTIGINSVGSVQSNGSSGVDVSGGNNTIGPDNVISGNTGDGINVVSSDNTIFGNYIGTDAGGTLASGFGNGMAGIRLGGPATGNTIGGTVVDEKNIIAGNVGNGITITGAGATDNVVLGNDIGRRRQGNGEDGIVVTDGAHDNAIGPDNRISNNGHSGVLISGISTMSNTISGNTVHSNTLSGVGIYEAQYNIIGGATYEDRNEITGNGWYGILIEDAQDNTIASNRIGTFAYGNALDGVYLCANSSGNIIGGATYLERNIIYNNGRHGINISEPSAIGNPITHNSIEFNAGEGIKAPDGWVPAAPIIAATMPGSVHIIGTSCAGCSVEVFQSLLDSGEGYVFIGDTIADSSGAFTVTVDSLPLDAPFLTATATDGTNTTSEFSAVFESTIQAVYLPLVVRNY